MTATVVIGAQWGDEGKGKITDMLAAESDVVARYGGGDNAGHTVVVGGDTFKLHLVPSGILYSHVVCVLGGGMVVNPRRLLQEMDGLAARGVDVSAARLLLSIQAHLILPYHIALDGAAERSRGKSALGTTKRGIGPAYADKAARSGIRAGEMRDPSAFAERVRAAVITKNELLTRLYGQEPLPAEEIAREYQEYAVRLAPHLADTSSFLVEALHAGKRLLCEGAQGTLLDLDHGTYPYVTSSYPTVGGALVGLGLGPQHLTRIIGVTKAYQTRVGAGPFPTELLDADGDHLVEVGHEYGTTTGRRRRAGWLDAVALRYAVQVNGLSELALTKLDVLGGLDPLRIAVAYTCDGETLTRFPADAAMLARCQPVYEELSGWEEDISAARAFDDLPQAARAYVARIEELAGVPATLISVGPEREQTICRP
ncbi:MAG: adenylosuccinate synthase [Chloroflexota bacterium]|nr:MAG: adenylosuccinate synthase [Chloroflexota bacterium]